MLLVLVLLNSALLASPNLLGKIGLIIYKYHYLRSFPRTLVTVIMVTFTALMTVEVVFHFLKKQKIGKFMALLILGIFLSVCLGMMAKTIIDFSTWSYGHTGIRFRLGAYLLPCVLIIIFIEGIWQVSRYGQLRAGDEDVPRNED